MPCTQCGKVFGVFEKEKVCQKCDFIFCSRCLSYKAAVPKYPNKKSIVCYTCYESITNPHTTKELQLEPPKILIDRMKAIGLHPAGPIKYEPNKPSTSGIPSTSSQIDDLTRRLNALQSRQSSGAIPSIEELERRLAKLKEDGSPTTVKAQISRVGADDIESIVKQVSDEAKLDGPYSDEVKYEDELPWCIICNENATVRCEDCDNDLFCRSCFKKGHSGRSNRNHHTVPYKKQPK